MKFHTEKHIVGSFFPAKFSTGRWRVIGAPEF